MMRLILAGMLAAVSVAADVTVAPVFGDGMVLQCDQPVRIWGTAEPGEKVTVEFADQTASGVASGSGEWQVVLDPMVASSTASQLVIHSSFDTCHLTLNNVVVGEVWLAGGQSNMQWPMNNFRPDTQEDIDRADDSLLRLINIPRLEYAGQNSARPTWKDSTPRNTASFSATAYYFAKNLRETLGVPVGMIVCAVGGSPIEAWLSRAALERDPMLDRTLAVYDRCCAEAGPVERQIAAYEKMKTAWEKARSGPRPQPPMGPLHFQRPAGLHETMLLQTVPYTIRGAIWYQGENNANAGTGFLYRTALSALINEWRELYRDPQLPFLFVQLPTFGNSDDHRPLWPELRESQTWVERNVPVTGMAVLLDGGDQKNIHPHSKDKAGGRLALLARNIVYGEPDLVCRGPRILSSVSSDRKIILTFDQPPVLRDGNAFELCGPDGKFVPAEAVVEGDCVAVFSPDVTQPEFVRYGWRIWLEPQLFNEQGLPASPFRTDDFTSQTKGGYYLSQLEVH